MGNGIVVRRFEEKDLDAVFRMINSSFATPVLGKVYEDCARSFWLSEYTKEKILESAGQTHFYVAELDGEIVGSGGVGEEEGKAYIYGVFTDPGIQKGGIGTRIMETLENDEISQKCKKVFLTAALSAGKFYQKLGYTYKYEVPEIVVDGCLDVVYMEKELQRNISPKKKVLLLGDSIRIGYGEKVKELLSDIAEVTAPEDNCRWTKYTYWNFSLWAGEERYDVIHFNNGIWDLHHIDGEDHFTSLEDYVKDNERLAALVSKYTKKMIWATSTPGGKVLDERKALNVLENTDREFKKRFLTSDRKDWNQGIEIYNEAAVRLYTSLGAEIDDLHGVLSEHLEEYLSPDGIHPNDLGYDVLARRVAATIRKSLTEE